MPTRPKRGDLNRLDAVPLYRDTNKLRNQFICSMKSILSVAVALCLTFVLLSCGTSKMTFENSSVAPAATGDVKVKKDKNENYAVNVNVKNLAPSQKLTPSKEMYLVWMEDGKNPVKKLGRIDPSSSLKASLTALTTTEPTKLFITAEDNAEVTFPTGEMVLTTKK